MNKRKTALRTGAAAIGAAAVAGAAWIALPAEAATTGIVQVVGGNIVTYTAATGKANTVVLTRSGNRVTVDDVFGIKAGTGCSAVSGDVTKINCALAVAPVWVRVDLGDGNDTLINNSGLGMTARGRAGNDKITGGPLKDDVYGGDGVDTISGLGGGDTLRGEGGSDTISGGDGDDFLFGGAAGDRLLGGAGDDGLWGDAGNDVVDGGAGDDVLLEGVDTTGADADSLTGGAGEQDILTYSERTKPVSADADGVAGDDGRTGEKDTVSGTIEVIIGGNAGDRLLGTAREDMLIGGPGNDALAAGDADDILAGEEGTDLFNGANGDDFCADPVAGETVLNCERIGTGPVAAARAKAAQTELDKVKQLVERASRVS
ncbi:hypothetical protein Aab01nite_59270 [Paractinoplanes abujensis]|uniref:Ca2+-binding RTX toxin-like protein n=1 Tax=Paractinoplanes abujensis TaxID=882441 RepID=A0A7W7CX83_9ACTN|nr:calcium-binding protein [Actinoplanes abujensis]MBB4696344.1 Ca2+-binding RTX toxin-like protein [Actinoplanes abujensis]GID22337.1 hypothetical protein Aab01nite_59270 [Actinoplanes abujensis]